MPSWTAPLHGSDTGFFAPKSAPLATFGATDVTTVPSVHPGKRDILFVNRHSGLRGYGTGPTSGGVYAYIYWGNPTRSYSEVDLLKLPPLAHELPIAAADLAAEDDSTDIVAFELGAREVAIFRIADSGYEKRKSFALPGTGAMVRVADLDRNGALDLAFTAGNKLYLIRNPLYWETDRRGTKRRRSTR